MASKPPNEFQGENPSWSANSAPVTSGEDWRWIDRLVLVELDGLYPKSTCCGRNIKVARKGASVPTVCL